MIFVIENRNAILMDLHPLTDDEKKLGLTGYENVEVTEMRNYPALSVRHKASRREYYICSKCNQFINELRNHEGIQYKPVLMCMKCGMKYAMESEKNTIGDLSFAEIIKYLEYKYFKEMENYRKNYIDVGREDESCSEHYSGR